MMAVLLLLLGADKRTLIPIKYRHCTIPDILRYIAMLDYTRVDTKPWFWQRLASSLRTATPQSAILHPFAGGPGYPLMRSYSTTSDYSSQPYPWPSFDLLAPAPAPEPPSSPPTAHVHMEMMPVSSQFPEVQPSTTQQSDSTEPLPKRYYSKHHSSHTSRSSHTSSSSKLPSFLKSKKKE